MFIKTRPVKDQVHIIAATPFLVAGIASTAVGAYYLSLNEDLTAIWLLLVGFGGTSISTLIAARVKFLSKPLVRKLFTYPLFAALLLFVSHLTIGIFGWAWHGASAPVKSVAQEHNKFKNLRSLRSLGRANSARPF